MKDSIKAIFSEWLVRIESEDEGCVAGWLPDYYLLGAAKFIKEVSCAINDDELISISVKIEMFLEERERVAEREEEQWRAEQLERISHMDNVSDICKKAFFKDRLFSVDLSKYHSRINELDSSLDNGVIERLGRYFDHEKVLYGIFGKVKNKLLDEFREVGVLPRAENVIKHYEIELLNFHGRAERYLSSAVEDIA